MTRACLLPATIAFSGALAGMMSLPLPVQAQAFVSGSQLSRACSGRAGPAASSCDGYIAGALDAIRDTPELKDKLCPPSGVKLSVLREALGKYGQLHPDDAKGPGVALVAAFIRSTYPCSAK